MKCDICLKDFFIFYRTKGGLTVCDKCKENLDFLEKKFKRKRHHELIKEHLKKGGITYGKDRKEDN